MDFESKSSWDHIVEMTKTMLVSAENQVWGELTELQSKRDILIRQYFLQRKSAGQTSMMAGSIQDILDLDKKILGYCLEHKNNISKELSGFSTGRRANNAYLDNAALKS